MKSIASLFEKYKATLQAPQATVEKQVVEVINRVTGFALTVEQVTYQPGSRTVTLQVPSIVKSEVLKQRGVILDTLSRKLGEGSAPKTLL